MRPDLVLASANAGPPQTLQRLPELGIEVETVSDSPSLDSLAQRIRQVAGRLGVPQRGDALIQRIQAEVSQAGALAAPPRRALVLVNRSGPLQGAGGHTAADAVLRLAGLDNVLAGQQGYKPLSAESLAVLAPELIVITSTSLQASGGMEKFRADTGIAATPAGRKGRIAVIDDLLILGIGPRVAQGIRQLKEAAR